MSDLLHDPFIQSSLLPLAIGLLATGVLHLLRRSLAVAAIPLTFVAVFLLVVGLPALPPPSSMGKLFWASAAGLVLGIVADALGARGRGAATLLAVWFAASLLWIALPALDGVGPAVTLLLLLGAGGWIAFGSGFHAPGTTPSGTAPSGTAPSGGATGPASVLLALALAVGGTALIGSSASIAQMGLALAAAAGAFLLWNWPAERHGWGLSGQVALGIALLTAAVLALFTDSRAVVLILALPALAAGRVRRLLPLPETGLGRAAGAAAVTIAAVVPALAALGAAFVLGGGEASPY
ncbi:hypothetical protein [Azospirillum picis]|uniref:Uncharacterized protein n=1 Tax=Azospirillum picis TaxID=488438 RepID=A0ABU0MIR9_9PROT|nr:hypothetical protein [Azospirillum picis]MBP2299218.1 hypothetical protein [Azospirillum picis]MDQ0533144.1 hypothetical protein [Azospirillum picis]